MKKVVIALMFVFAVGTISTTVSAMTGNDTEIVHIDDKKKKKKKKSKKGDAKSCSSSSEKKSCCSKGGAAE